MTTSVDPRTKLENLVAALDHERPTDEEAREVVAALGVDVPALAARIRARAATATGPAAELRARLEADRSRRRAPEPVRPRDEQIRRLQVLMTRAARRPGGAAVAAHFRKFEEAGDEELRAMLTSLRDLLGDDAGDDGEGEG